MRTAYSGRAAAYEKKGDYLRAVSDLNMVVLFYAVELEVLNDQSAQDRDKFMLEASQAYRARGNVLRELRKPAAAEADTKYAAALEADAKTWAETTRLGHHCILNTVRVELCALLSESVKAIFAPLPTVISLQLIFMLPAGEVMIPDNVSVTG